MEAAGENARLGVTQESWGLISENSVHLTCSIGYWRSRSGGRVNPDATVCGVDDTATGNAVTLYPQRKHLQRQHYRPDGYDK